LDILILTEELLLNRQLRGDIRDCIDEIAMKKQLETDIVFTPIKHIKQMIQSLQESCIGAN